MNKRGFLLGEHTINIIIAILAIVVLVFLGIGIFGIFSSNNDFRIAEAHVNNIKAIILGLKEKGGGTQNYVLVSPKKWAIISWPAYDVKPIPGGPGGIPYSGPIMISNGDIPIACKTNEWNKCVCLCDYSSGISLKKCNENGVCFGDKDLDIIVKNSKDLADNQRSYIDIKSLIKSGKEIEISLDNNKVIISRNP
ncbi:MAG: hypothetical protein QXI33_00585 [Candidatus Pacearchaeota archaeon]